jgi:hypothetical protein
MVSDVQECTEWKNLKKKGKGKGTLEQAKEVQRGSRGISLLFL